MGEKVANLAVHRNERRARQSARIVRTLENSVEAMVAGRKDIGGYAVVVFTADHRGKCTGTQADWWDPDNLFGPGLVPEAVYRALERQENSEDVRRDYGGSDPIQPDDDEGA